MYKPVSTTGKQADVQQRLVAELGGLVAQHGLRTAHLHTPVPQPADQPGQLAVALEGVVAQVAARRGKVTFLQLRRAQLKATVAIFFPQKLTTSGN